jgi:uncharacterized protein YfaP (DUF2135 family)
MMIPINIIMSIIISIEIMSNFLRMVTWTDCFPEMITPIIGWRLQERRDIAETSP